MSAEASSSSPRKRDQLRLLVVGLAQLILVVVGVPALLLYAVFFAPRKAEETSPAKTMTLAISKDLVRASPGRYCIGDVATLLVVHPSDKEKGTFTTARATGNLRTKFTHTPPNTVRFRMERGEADSAVTPVVAALAEARDVYLIADERCPRGGGVSTTSD